MAMESFSHQPNKKSCYTAFGMDKKSLETLELPIILDRLATYAAFSASKELARALRPTGSLTEARRRQAETTEARAVLSLVPDLTIGGARDVRPQIEAASRSAILEPTELLDIKSTLIAARSLRNRFEKSTDIYPQLAAMAENLEPYPDIIGGISRVLSERGEVLDSASVELSTIRRDLHVARDRLTGKLQRMLKDPDSAHMLQEPIITQRDGRYVIPLRAEFKGRIQSVIHDQSSSGATLFIEPLVVVEFNNQIRELQLAERDEIRRILSELSQIIGGRSEALIATVDALAMIDLAFAKARYAEELKANEPILKPFQSRGETSHPGSTVRLMGARHPLLEPESVVPIDLILDKDTYALVITGPNTGGKTVSLKTAGLLAIMAQCGLHIPVISGSELSVFEAIYADIGDEQSIEQSLSTFSSHISNIIQILQHAGRRSLVVLDELGAGTDPQEGAALARAILGVLLDRQVTTLVATHYPELKSYAHTTPGVRNASVEFDLESLRPTYHLTIGLPGRSNALAIATRLGLEGEIIDRARTMVAPEDLQAESLLDEIHHQREVARQDRADAEQARERAQTMEAELARRLEGIEDERYKLLEEARSEAETEVDAVRQELLDIRRQLARAAQPLEVVESIESSLEELEARVEEPTPRPQYDIQRPIRPFRLGDRVRLHTINAEGVITDLGSEKVEVQVGRLRVRARLDELSLPERGEAQPEIHLTQPRERLGEQHILNAPPLELDLRGRMVDEGLEELERRLDAAYLAGMPFVRVIHGKGTGRLREAVRQALRNVPYVSSFEPGKPSEGGDGVTLVRLQSG